MDRGDRGRAGWTGGIEGGRTEGIEGGRTGGIEGGRTEGIEGGRTGGIEGGQTEGRKIREWSYAVHMDMCVSEEGGREGDTYMGWKLFVCGCLSHFASYFSSYRQWLPPDKIEPLGANGEYDQLKIASSGASKRSVQQAYVRAKQYLRKVGDATEEVKTSHRET